VLAAIPREVVLAFVLSRLGVVAAVALAFLAGDALGLASGRADLLGLDGPFAMWGNWDAGFFLEIAREGYAGKTERAAFYPLYPTLVSVVSAVLPGSDVWAGLAVSAAAGLGSFVLLHRIAKRRLGAGAARRAVLYLAVFPTTLFLGAVYSESLFLLLALATFDLAERRNYPAAGVAAGLALLTRPTGVAVVLALAVFLWQAPDRRRALWALAPVPVLFAVFPLLLWHEAGDPLAFLRAEDAWERSATPLGPLAGLVLAAYAAKVSVVQLVDGSGVHHFLDAYRMEIAFTNLEAAAYLLFALLLLPVVRKQLGPGAAPYFVYAAASVVIPLSVPASAPLLSFPRFALVMFPLLLALAALGERPRVHRTIVALSTVLLAVTVARWALFYWVA
jgi:4-amino-4-deoxy-L-arabinose transferase-like glycosyltransferase